MRFTPGQFLGKTDLRSRIGDIDLADMRPTVPAREVESHEHEDAHLIVLHRGAYASSARGMPDICTTPAVVLNPPGTHHRDHFASLDGARFLTISIPPGLWHRYSSAARSDVAAMRLPACALPAAYRLWHEMLPGDAAAPLAAEAALHELLASAGTVAGVPHSPAPGWLRQARARIEDAPGDVPSITELARDADMHPVYFARAFRRAYGTGPAELLRRRRLEAAVADVCAGHAALGEIALRHGYADQSHMHRALRTATGLTPSGLRKLGRLKVTNLQDARRT